VDQGLGDRGADQRGLIEGSEQPLDEDVDLRGGVDVDLHVGVAWTIMSGEAAHAVEVGPDLIERCDTDQDLAFLASGLGELPSCWRRPP
jgi:hypothetical protein